MTIRYDIRHSTIYTQFHAIEKGDYYRQIRYVRKFSDRLKTLDLEEHLEILQAYREALFQMAKYREHIEVSDELIALSMAHHVIEFNGEDLFFDTLLQKAASLYNIGENDAAIHVLKELIKIDPSHDTARLMLMRGYVLKEKRERTMFLRAMSIVCFLVSACLVAIDLLVLRPFFEAYSRAGSLAYQGLFLSGVGLLIFDQIHFRYIGVSRALNWIRESKLKNNRNLNS